MEPKTKKGLIIGGSVTVAVLLTAGITTGIVLGIKNNVPGLVEGPVITAAFSDGVSSSAERQDKWMGIDFDTESETYDGTLIKNSYYHSVTIEEEMMDVVSSEDGVGYMSNVTLSKDSRFRTLNVANEDVATGATWIAPSGAIPTAAPLDMVMKVPQPVSAVLNDFMPSDSPTDALTFEMLNVDGSDYGTWIQDNYAFDFAISFIFFAWVAESETAHNAIAAEGFGIQNADLNVADADFAEWVKTVFADTAWGIVNSDGDIDFNGHKGTGAYEMNIDGTGTDEMIVNIALESLSDATGFTMLQQLNNHGSGAAWYMDSDNETPDWAGSMASFEYIDPGMYGDSSNSGYWGSFIGTQSRGMNDGDSAFGGFDASDTEHTTPLTGWGYDWSIYTSTANVTTGDATDAENVMYNYDVTSDNDDIPLATTIGTDNIVFYTTVDAFFEMDGVEYTPTGLTRAGAKDLFQNGLSYQELVAKDELQYVERV